MDSPRLPYEGTNHWELEARNKQAFIDHFMSTKFVNLHITKAVRFDFQDLFTKVTSHIHYSYNVNTVGEVALTNRYNVIMSLMKTRIPRGSRPLKISKKFYCDPEIYGRTLHLKPTFPLSLTPRRFLPSTKI